MGTHSVQICHPDRIWPFLFLLWLLAHPLSAPEQEKKKRFKTTKPDNEVRKQSQRHKALLLMSGSNSKSTSECINFFEKKCSEFLLLSRIKLVAFSC